MRPAGGPRGTVLRPAVAHSGPVGAGSGDAHGGRAELAHPERRVPRRHSRRRSTPRRRPRPHLRARADQPRRHHDVVRDVRARRRRARTTDRGHRGPATRAPHRATAVAGGPGVGVAPVRGRSRPVRALRQPPPGAGRRHRRRRRPRDRTVPRGPRRGPPHRCPRHPVGCGRRGGLPGRAHDSAAGPAGHGRRRRQRRPRAADQAERRPAPRERLRGRRGGRARARRDPPRAAGRGAVGRPDHCVDRFWDLGRLRRPVARHVGRPGPHARPRVRVAPADRQLRHHLLPRTEHHGPRGALLPGRSARAGHPVARRRHRRRRRDGGARRGRPERRGPLADPRQSLAPAGADAVRPAHRVHAAALRPLHPGHLPVHGPRCGDGGGAAGPAAALVPALAGGSGRGGRRGAGHRHRGPGSLRHRLRRSPRRPAAGGAAGPARLGRGHRAARSDDRPARSRALRRGRRVAVQRAAGHLGAVRPAGWRRPARTARATSTPSTTSATASVGPSRTAWDPSCGTAG